MGWFENLLKVIAEGLGLVKQSTDPEVIRLSKIIEIDKRLEAERKKRDENMAIKRTPENELALGAELGFIVDNIVSLRQARKGLER